MKQLWTELSGRLLTKPITIFGDNQLTIAVTKNPHFHGHSKHDGIKYISFVRDRVAAERMIKIEYCPTSEMIADVLMKGLSKVQFVKLREMIGLDKCSDSQ